MRTIVRFVLGTVVTLVLGHGQLEAQIREVEDGATRPVRFQAGGHLDLALPQGEFSEFVDAGFGIGGWAAINLDRRGFVALRLDATWLNYGSETRRRPLSTTVPFVTVDVTTQNNIYAVGLGPMITLSQGPIRPYLSGQIGFSYFATESSVKGTSNSESFAKSTNFDDFTFAWTGGGGLKIRVSNGRVPIFIDGSADYVRNGRVQYLREGSITDDGMGNITIQPIESETNLLVIRLGVSGAW
ncbi:MAG: hypothetical protein AB7I33_09780 [Gemmatimonadales bacterium]